MTKAKSDWRPIATAKRGEIKPIILLDPWFWCNRPLTPFEHRYAVVTGRWNGIREDWEYIEFPNHYKPSPTHWQPMPEPTEAEMTTIPRDDIRTWEQEQETP